MYLSTFHLILNTLYSIQNKLNFIGHAYIARNNPELIAGNFAGDSYKGHLDKFTELSLNVLNGVRLHRFIDDFTDHSKHILKAGKILQKEGINKISFIATDIILDHYLTKNWGEYSNIAYPEFIDFIYKNTDSQVEHLDAEFQFLYSKLKEHKWLYYYPTEEGIQETLFQFSKRIGFENDLDKCMNIYLNNQKTFDQHFSDFLIEIEAASVEFISSL